MTTASASSGRQTATLRLPCPRSQSTAAEDGVKMSSPGAGIPKPSSQPAMVDRGTRVVLVTKRTGMPPSRIAAAEISDPATLEIAGDDQSGTVAERLTMPRSVRVLNADDRPLANVPVTWEVVTGEGTLTAEDVTDDFGVAEALWILGTGAGTQEVGASVSDVDPVRFSAPAANWTASSSTVPPSRPGRLRRVRVDTRRDPGYVAADRHRAGCLR